ncbi:MAG: hypothetical protein HY376_02520 [Candidatus Blackburnbacteria bacterium]|nr:hypothetical protein [Candidatus Blackburnbacteria bacterium]
MLKNMRGFAALELAVVIGFFAVVVAVVIFYLNPIERAKQQHDQRLSDDAQKVLNALNSFYTARGRMPWAAAIDTDTLSPALAWKPLRASEVGICQDESCKDSGELTTSGFLSQDFKSSDSVLGRNGVIYVGKAARPKNPVWACFLPISEKLRKDTGQLYRISLDKPLAASGSLNTCPSNLTWGEEDVCYACVAK